MSILVNRDTALALLDKVDAELTQSEQQLLTRLKAFFQRTDDDQQPIVWMQNRNLYPAAVYWHHSDVKECILMYKPAELVGVSLNDLEQISQEIAQQVDWSKVRSVSEDAGRKYLYEEVQKYIHRNRLALITAQVIHLAKEQGWKCELDECFDLTFSKESPAGAMVEFKVDGLTAVSDVNEFANSFNISEHVERTFQKQNPDSKQIFSAIKDAEAIQKMLRALAMHLTERLGNE